jgi:hypothetical protein
MKRIVVLAALVAAGFAASATDAASKVPAVGGIVGLQDACACGGAWTLIANHCIAPDVRRQVWVRWNGQWWESQSSDFYDPSC